MAKMTFNTIYSLARKGKLIGKVKYEFDGMDDSLNLVIKQKEEKYTEEMVKNVKMTKNYLRLEDGKIILSNCCYKIIFTALS